MEQDTVVTAIEWLLFAIFVTAVSAWLLRLLKHFLWVLFHLNAEPYPGETLGLPKGAVRSFLVLAFTAIVYLIFADGLGTDIDQEDKKWFLTAYGTILAFYFAQRTVEARATRPGLGVFGIYPSSGRQPKDGSRPLKVTIDGNGFDSPTSVTIIKDGKDLAKSGFTTVSTSTLDVLLNITKESPLGGYDVTVELANGSRLVRRSGFMVEPPQG